MNAPPTFNTLTNPRQRGVPVALRGLATALAVFLALGLTLIGCRDPEVTTESPEESPEEATERVALEPGAEPTESGQAPCPEPRELPADRVCAQVVTYAQSPEGGRCCFYGSPCEAPEDWTRHADPACTAPLTDTATGTPPAPPPEETTREL